MNFFDFVLVTLAVYSVARVLVKDDLFDGTRNRFHGYLADVIEDRNDEFHGWYRTLCVKVFQLTDCLWCCSFWFAVAGWWLWLDVAPWQWELQVWFLPFATRVTVGWLSNHE